MQLAGADAAGRDIILHVAGPGCTIAEASLFSSIYHCDAVAITQALVRKALSDQQISGLRAGLGMSLALAAANGYPGPRLRIELDQCTSHRGIVL